MFENLAAILARGGATLAQIARLTVYVRSPDYRSLVNAHWVKAFPDEGSRPARHTMINPHLPAGMHVQCEAVAYILPIKGGRENER
jgi:2-iminobutanoate/2-iminopropanoate deaminase